MINNIQTLVSKGTASPGGVGPIFPVVLGVGGTRCSNIKQKKLKFVNIMFIFIQRQK
jgi:hypothetical protein